MKKIDKNVWIILLAAGVFLFIVFLPKIDALISNIKYVNKPIVVKNEKDDGIHYDLSIEDKLEIISSNQTAAMALINKTNSLEEINKNDNLLLPSLQKEITILEEKRIIPVIKEKAEISNYLKGAAYYSISNQGGSILSVPVWVLEFSGKGECNYQFVVDAATYKIYALSLRVNDGMVGDFFKECEKEPKPRETTPEYIFIENMLNKMADYYEADSGYVSYMNELYFRSNLNYKDDFNGVNVEFDYDITYDSVPNGKYYVDGYQYVEMSVVNGENILNGYKRQR